ncbi:MAG: pilus assembly protein [Novosphingobium sp.]|nr:pilus assembly protein [Novosphingobium sp.]
MENAPTQPTRADRPASKVAPTTTNTLARLGGDKRGAVLIEAAFALPILIMLILGIITYASWYMAAHSIQQAANEAARAAVAGLDADERQELVDRSIASSVVNTGTLNPELVTVSTELDSNFYTVSVSYDVSQSNMFRNSLVPLPGDTITRDAVMQLNAL